MRREPMRPQFLLPLPLPAAEAVARVRAHLRAHPTLEVCSGTSHLVVRFRPAHRSFWTPWLDAHLRPAETGCRLVGRLTPHPAIWTGYVAAYAFLGLAALIALSYGFVQLTLGHPALALLVVPGVALLALTLYLSAFLGQRLADAEMRTLRAALEAALLAPALDDPAHSAAPPA